MIRLAVLVAAAAGAAPAEPLRIGGSADYPPFLWTDAAGHRVGIDADLFAEICARGAFECTWVQMPLAEVLLAVADGRVDVATGGIGYSADRDRTVDFSCPYAIYDDYGGVFYATEPGIDPGGTIVAVTDQSLFDHALRKGGYRTLGYPNGTEAIRATLAGKTGAYFGAAGNLDLVPEAAGALFTVGTLPVPPTGAAFAVNERAQGLRFRLNALLAELSAEGRIAALQEQWLGFNQGDIIAQCDLTFYQS